MVVGAVLEVSILDGSRHIDWPLKATHAEYQGALQLPSSIDT